MIELSCEYCETVFSRYPSQVTDGKNFCSQECCNDWQAEVGTTKRERKWNEEEMMDCPHSSCSFESGSIHGLAAHWGMIHEGEPPWKEHKCDNCGEVFNRPKCQLTGDKMFCGNACQQEAMLDGEVMDYPDNREEFTCETCGDCFRTWPNRRNNNRVFCSPECYAVGKQKEDSGLEYGKDWLKQRKKAIERDDGVCTFEDCERTECRTGRALHVHHITPLKEFEKPQRANTLDNLRTLCAEHHAKIEP